MAIELNDREPIKLDPSGLVGHSWSGWLLLEDGTVVTFGDSKDS